ncbi:MAG: DUF2807 domain-containing protein, partial [Saprospiraceae bacterium]|nr:DUF2807 domain-containing protein [Saprospiraceae bacterium]
YKIHRNVRTGIWTVWFLSLFTTLFAGMSTIREYSSSHNYTTTSDFNIAANEIKIVMPEENLDHSFGFQLGNLFVDNDDQWAVRDVRFKIEKSKDALVHIEKRISSRGTDSKEAQKNSLFVTNEVQVVGSEIKISKFLLIPKDKKFRNQQIDYVIYIPEGKSIELDNNVKESMSDSGLFSYEQIYSEIENLRWTVTPKGLISDTWNDLFHHKKEISTGSYSKIIIEKGFDVIIKKAGKPNLSFEGNKKILEKIIHKNLEGTLTINAETDENLEGIRILIETPSLELIHLDGVRIAKIEGFIQDNLKLVSKGESDMNEDTNIEFFGNIKNMDISLDGRQVLTMIGTGEKIDLQITNGAGINSDKYIVKNVNFTGSNYNDSSMHVTESITCDNPNELSVHLIGNPKKVKL